MSEEMETLAVITTQPKEMEQPAVEPVIEPVVAATEPVTPIAEPAPAAPVVAQPVVEAPKATIPTPEPVDPQLQKILDAHKSGKLEEYLELAKTDWGKKTDLDIITRGLEKEYEFLDPAKRAMLIERELKSKYGLGEYDEESSEAVLGKIQMEVDARRIRNGLIAEQESYKLPTYEPAIQEQANTPTPEQLAQRAEAWTATHLTDPAYKQFETSRVIQAGSGDEAFNFSVPAEFDAVDKVKNGLLEAVAMRNADGSFKTDDYGAPVWDMAKYLPIAAFAFNKEAYDAALIKHGRTLERKLLDGELRNSSNTPHHAQPAENEKGRVKWIG